MIGADDTLVIRRAGYQIAQATPAAFSSILVRPVLANQKAASDFASRFQNLMRIQIEDNS